MPLIDSGTRKIGLALGGGGARGFTHLGVAKALRELQVPIGYIAGTSIGAIIGAAIASDMLQWILNWTQEPDWFKLPGLATKFFLPRRAILGTKKIEAFFKKIVYAKTFDDLVIPFAAVATDLQTGGRVVMTSGDVRSAIRASMAIPGVFEPIERDGRVLVDGGLVNPLPVDVCRQLGATRVIAVDLNTCPVSESSTRSLKSMNIVDITDKAFEIIGQNLTQQLLEKSPPDLLLRPDVADVKVLDFRHGERLVQRGYECLMDQKDKVLELVA